MRGSEILGCGDAGVHVGGVGGGEDPFCDYCREDAGVAGAERWGGSERGRGGGDEDAEFAKGGEDGFVGLGEPGVLLLLLLG